MFKNMGKTHEAILFPHKAVIS